jgi:hypothetical protein
MEWRLLRCDHNPSNLSPTDFFRSGPVHSVPLAKMAPHLALYYLASFRSVPFHFSRSVPFCDGRFFSQTSHFLSKALIFSHSALGLNTRGLSDLSDCGLKIPLFSSFGMPYARVGVSLCRF